jgi:hypothetical protein
MSNVRSIGGRRIEDAVSWVSEAVADPTTTGIIILRITADDVGSLMVGEVKPPDLALAALLLQHEASHAFVEDGD